MKEIGGRKIVILGGGPAGLAAAYELAKQKQSPIVFEASNSLGGIAKTEDWKGYHFDIGGHRFFTKSEEINALWHSILSEKEFLKRPRLSRIYYQKNFFNYPLRPFNALFGLGIIESFRILFSYLRIKIFPLQKQFNFEEWVINRFGKRLYKIFFKTYTEKVWGIPCSEISTEWAGQRIKGLSLSTAIINAFFKNAKGQPKTLIDEFEYPKYGPGLMWAKMAEEITKSGGSISLNSAITQMGLENNFVKWIKVNNREKIETENVISSMPLRDLILNIEPQPEREVVQAAESLLYRGLITVILIIDESEIFSDNWIYIHSPEVRLGRIQNFKNWSPYMVPDQNKTCLGLEYFYSSGDELDKMKDGDLVELGIRELECIGFPVARKKVLKSIVIKIPKAYPCYVGNYKKSLDIIVRFLGQIKNFQTIGRNGMHRYNNMDHSMLTGLYAARNVLGDNYDLWRVNADEEYHESGSS